MSTQLLPVPASASASAADNLENISPNLPTIAHTCMTSKAASLKPAKSFVRRSSDQLSRHQHQHNCANNSFLPHSLHSDAMKITLEPFNPGTQQIKFINSGTISSNTSDAQATNILMAHNSGTNCPNNTNSHQLDPMNTKSENNSLCGVKRSREEFLAQHRNLSLYSHHHAAAQSLPRAHFIATQDNNQTCQLINPNNHHNAHHHRALVQHSKTPNSFHHSYHKHYELAGELLAKRRKAQSELEALLKEMPAFENIEFLY
jgi:hypothetical protein